MKQVRILKSGSYGGFSYKEGEIWDVISQERHFVNIEKGHKRSKVSISDHSSYGKEAEIIEENELTNQIEFIL